MVYSIILIYKRDKENSDKSKFIPKKEILKAHNFPEHVHQLTSKGLNMPSI